MNTKHIHTDACFIEGTQVCSGVHTAPIQSAELSLLREALTKIAAIEDQMYGADWEEIEEAREIANAALAAPSPAQQASSDHKAAFEAWAAKDGTYDLRPAKVKVLSVGGVPYDGYVRPYLQDRTVYTYQGYLAAMTGRSMHDAPAAQQQAKPTGLQATAHDLYTDADSNRPDAICDRNGQVALGLCKKCGKGESELAEPCTPPAARELTDADIHSLFGMAHNAYPTLCGPTDGAIHFARAIERHLSGKTTAKGE